MEFEQEMIEHSKFVDGPLKRFIRTIEDEVKAFALLFSKIPKDEVFRQMASGEGKGKSHASAQGDSGKLKNS